MAAPSAPLLCNSQIDLLLLVDMQVKLTAAMPAVSKALTLRNAARLAHAAGLLQVPVLVTEQYSKGLGPTEAEILQALPANTTHTFEKTAFSCCGADGFQKALQNSGRRQIVIAGMEAHVCVLQTALELQAQGWPVFVAEDAVCSRDEAHKAGALHRLRQAGVVVTTVESVLFEWLRDAKHEHFKTLATLIR